MALSKPSSLSGSMVRSIVCYQSKSFKFKVIKKFDARQNSSRQKKIWNLDLKKIWRHVFGSPCLADTWCVLCLSQLWHHSIFQRWVCVCEGVCVCVWVCVWERERESIWHKASMWEKQRVCGEECVCVRERGSYEEIYVLTLYFSSWPLFLSLSLSLPLHNVIKIKSFFL